MPKRFYERSADENYYFNFHKAQNNLAPTHYHSNIEMIFVIKGEVQIGVNGQNILLKKDDICIFHHFEVHYINGHQDSEIFVLVFSNFFWPESMRGKRFKNYLNNREKNETISTLLEYCYTLQHQNNVVLQMGIVNLLLGTLKNIYPVYSEENDSDRDMYVDILRYIDGHCTEPLSLEGIAAAFGYEKHYFSKVFNNFVGMHLREYINRLRIERIEQEKQENPNKSLMELIYSCGFSSLNTYYRALKLQKSNSEIRE